MLLSRRVFGTGLLAGLAASGAPAFSVAPAPRQRVNVSTLSATSDTLVALSTAIDKMQRRTDDLSWAWQAQNHADPRNRNLTTWRFLPWHRVQLVYFERIVRYLSGDINFAMPYWDWREDAIPAVFFDSRTRLSHAARERGPNDRMSDYFQMTNAEFSAAPTHAFAEYFGSPRRLTGLKPCKGSGEYCGPDLIQMFVGSDMGDPSLSPRDPLFWFHQANVDRLWASWHQQGRGGYDDSWRREPISGFVDASGNRAPPVYAGEVVDIRRIGYGYDALDLSGPGPAGPVLYGPQVGDLARRRRQQVASEVAQVAVQGGEDVALTLPAAPMREQLFRLRQTLEPMTLEVAAPLYVDAAYGASEPGVLELVAYVDGQPVDRRAIALLPTPKTNAYSYRVELGETVRGVLEAVQQGRLSERALGSVEVRVKQRRPASYFADLKLQLSSDLGFRETRYQV